MKRASVILLAAALLASCDKTKQAIDTTGVAVGKGSAELVSSVAEGVDQTLQSTINVSKNLADKGLALGKYTISSFSVAGKNELTVYLIFNQDFNETISVKVFDKDNQEYGRTTLAVTGKKGETKYVDFTFDKRAVFESKSRFDME